MPRSVRQYFAVAAIGAVGILVAAIGRAIQSDSLIALATVGGILLFLAGLALRVDYGAVRTEYEDWLRSRNRAVEEGAAARFGLAEIFAGVVFAISGGVGVWVY